MRAAAFAIAICACGSSHTEGPGWDAAPEADATPGIPDAAPAPFPSSDTFDGSALDPSWTILDPSKLDVAVGGGQLTLTPHAGALWYNLSSGGLVYKRVTGDFTATATVHAHKASAPSMPPDQTVELGGVMAHVGGGAQNYVFLVIGFGEQGHLAVEHKSTVDDVSSFAESPFVADGELRLCRQGATITVYERTIGAATWTQDFQVARPDFPDTLQVGPNAYDGDAAPDVAISFDDFTFAPLANGDCTQ